MSEEKRRSQEEEEKASFLGHSGDWAYGEGHLPPSAAKLKRQQLWALANLEASADSALMIERVKTLQSLFQGEELKKRLVDEKLPISYLGAFAYHTKGVTHKYRDYTQAEDGNHVKTLTQWVISQRTGVAHTIKKLSVWQKLRGKSPEPIYQPVGGEQ